MGAQMSVREHIGFLRKPARRIGFRTIHSSLEGAICDDKGLTLNITGQVHAKRGSHWGVEYSGDYHPRCCANQ